MLARVKVPTAIARGEVFEIKVLLQHPMETGYRFDMLGAAVPKNVIHTLRVQYDGRLIFRAEMSTGISANPYLSFYTRATRSGALQLDWSDEKGQQGQHMEPVQVS